MTDATHATDRLSRRIRDRALDLGFDTVGLAPLRPSDHAALYRAWIERGHHGVMGYLSRDDAVRARLDPLSRWPELRSAVVVTHHYATPEADSDAEPESDAGDRRETTRLAAGQPTAGDPATGVIARYARGRDYHKVVKKKLLALLRWIEEETGESLLTARAYVDTGPVLERELARRAGLGWQGRNTMLIDPRRGSYFFLGSLLLPFQLDYDHPFESDHCGSCHACLDACPTGALLGRDENGAPIMDATRCISYLTIENQGPIPEELRPLMGNRVYGCDICQEVCPWNSPKLVQVTREADYLPRVPSLPRETGRPGSRPDTDSSARAHTHPHTHAGPSTAAPSLVELMRMTRDEWDRWTRGSAIRRAGYAGFKRNVAIAIGNSLSGVDQPPEEAVAALREALDDEEELVREHAAWALREAGSDRE